MDDTDSSLRISALKHLSATVWVRLTHLTVGELAHADAIRVQDIFLAICELDGLDT